MRILLTIFILAQFPLLGQNEIQQGEFIVKFVSAKTAKNWQQQHEEYELEPLVKDWELYLLKFDQNKTDALELEQLLKKDPFISNIQNNHILKWRKTPDDPEYNQWQWNLDKLGLPEAWEYTTGGLAGTDTIVVAVIDGGFDINHEDLKNNIWYNYNEIPNDNIDNDQNGYVDDYKGWQILNENDEHLLDGHGTSVAGIIGAEGNNSIGMTGINWKTKLMLISAAEPDLLYESNIIKAYGYVLKMRKLYDSSNGLKGAYIIATNLSAGVDFGRAEDYPLWCAIYDSLGQAGILSVGAVMNKRKNVDIVGDMPTTCTSDYLITVTNSTAFDALNQNAAYGFTHVDISAPGEVYSTRVNNSYNVFAGSSGAAPHVAAAVALLASLPNERWQRFLKQYPVKAIEQLKSILLSTVFFSNSMRNKTRSGGRLNIGNAMKLLNRIHTEEQAIRVLQFGNEGTLLFQFQPREKGIYQWEIFDVLGRLRYQTSFNIHNTDEIQLEQLNWDGLSNEILIIRLRKGKKQIAAQKFIKK